MSPDLMSMMTTPPQSGRPRRMSFMIADCNAGSTDNVALPQPYGAVNVFVASFSAIFVRSSVGGAGSFSAIFDLGLGCPSPAAGGGNGGGTYSDAATTRPPAVNAATTTTAAANA